MNFGYPKHDTLAMPLLSPTMEKGTIQQWNFEVGDKLSAGDVLCEVETDKSTVGFEVQEDFYLAQKFFDAGASEIGVGTIIAIGCKNKEDIPAFKNISLKDMEGPLPTKPEQPEEISQGSYPKHEKMQMPLLSPTMEKGTIQKWNFKEGDKISAGEVLCEVETDKSTVGFEIQEDIFLAKILVPERGSDIQVGQTIAIGVTKKKYIESFKDYQLADTEQKEQVSKKQEASSHVQQAPKTDQPKPQTIVQQETQQTITKSGDRIFASPLAKKTAKDKGILLSDINNASGPKGRILQQDVRQDNLKQSSKKESSSSKKPQYVEEFQSQNELQFVPAENPYLDTPTSLIRRTIAKRLIQSKNEIPHFYLSINLKMDMLLDLRAQLNKNKEKSVKISINDFIIKATGLALRDMPAVNSQWFGNTIRTFKHADVCVAVSSDRGLITPIVFMAEQKSVSEISSNMKILARKARDNKLALKEYQGGTFTISNLGMAGIDQFTAVINPPQACILAVSKTNQILEPVANNPSQPFKIVNIMNVTLSCDHRVVDGQVGADWLNKFRYYIENPFEMLM